MTEQTSNKVALFIMHRALPGKRDQVRQVWERHMQALITQNRAHENYFYCYDNNDPDAICVYQQYSDHEASQAFLENPSYADYHKEVTPLLAGEPKITAATPLWIKGA